MDELGNDPELNFPLVTPANAAVFTFDCFSCFAVRVIWLLQEIGNGVSSMCK